MRELTLLWGILVVVGFLVFANFIALFSLLHRSSSSCYLFVEVIHLFPQETPEISHSLDTDSKTSIGFTHWPLLAVKL